MNLALWLWRSAARAGDNPALFTGTDCTASYTEFAHQAGAIAAALTAQHDVQPGERVALFAKNAPAYLSAMIGIWAAGAVAVPINAKLHPKEAAHIIADAAAKLCFVDSSTARDLETGCPLIDLKGDAFAAMVSQTPIAAPVERAAGDLAWLFYTSGTTGRPKGVMLSHGNLMAMSYAYLADVDQPLPGCASVYAAPLSHGAGLYALPHVLRGSAHVVPASGGFDAAELLALGKHFGDISMFAAPTMVKRLVDHAMANGETGKGLNTIIYGGGPMYTADIEEAVAAFGPRFIQIYGQGETPMTITTLSRAAVADRSHPRWRDRLGSVGTAHSCIELRIADEAGKPMPAGETGEILVRGATVMQGYWNMAQASAETLRGGWLWTGDLGVLDADGYLTLKDRSKDVIISGGTNIYPREVEEALLTHPQISEVSVFGRADTDWGEVVVAYVVASGALNPSELDAHCIAQIARFKRPKHYVFVESLPKNNNGKVLKTELRVMDTQPLAQSPHRVTHS